MVLPTVPSVPTDDNKEVTRFLEEDATVDRIDVVISSRTLLQSRRFLAKLHNQTFLRSLSILSIEVRDDATLGSISRALANTQLDRVDTLKLVTTGSLECLDRPALVLLEGVRKSSFVTENLILGFIIETKSATEAFANCLAKLKGCLKHLEVKRILPADVATAHALSEALSQLQQLKSFEMTTWDPVSQEKSDCFLPILGGISNMTSIERLQIQAALIVGSEILTESFTSHTLPRLVNLKHLEIRAYQTFITRSLKEEDMSRFCVLLGKALQSNPSINSIELDWADVSLQPLLCIGTGFSGIVELKLSFRSTLRTVELMTREGQPHVSSILQDCTSVERLSLTFGNLSRQWSGDLRALAATMGSSCPRLRFLAISEWDHLGNRCEPLPLTLQNRAAIVDLATKCRSLETLEIRDTLHSFALSFELAKNRMHFHELPQGNLPKSLWPMILSKQAYKMRFDGQANLDFLFKFMKQMNPHLVR